MYKVKVIIGKAETVILVNKKENLLTLLKSENIMIPSPCGGKGFCGKCKVKVVSSGHTQKDYQPHEFDFLSQIERNHGYRLACSIEIDEDLTIEILNIKKEEAVILVDSIKIDSNFDPSIKRIGMQLSLPSISDQRSDEERVLDQLPEAFSMIRDTLYMLPTILRESNFNIDFTTWENNILDVHKKNSQVHCHGIAIDIGTTTFVAYLIDLITGEQIDVYSNLNPQRDFGADVITRTDYTIENTNGLTKLSTLIRAEINIAISQFTEQQKIKNSDIYHITVVGNTIMMHIFAGLPVKNIATSPFIPVYTKGFSIDARELNITIHPNGKITLLPCVAGYIGADTIASVIASDMAHQDEIALLIDIGTNGEIVIGNKDRLLSCSTAAGPAFEGASIRYGLGGVKGAINKAFINEDVIYTTIGGEPALGICGSGLVDIISFMKDEELIDSTGRMQNQTTNEASKLNARIGELDGKPSFLIASKKEGAAQDIYICQRDLREVQLAKAAIASGIRILMKEFHVEFANISHVYLAGGFGNYINYDHACNIGLLPLELRSRFISIGNGAGMGAKMCLLSKQHLKNAENIKKMMGYIELSSSSDFQDLFVDMMMF